MKRKSRTIGKWSSFRQALKSVLKSEEIKVLTDRLEALRSQMNMQMLAFVGEQQYQIWAMLKEVLREKHTWVEVDAILRPISHMQPETPRQILRDGQDVDTSETFIALNDASRLQGQANGTGPPVKSYMAIADASADRQILSDQVGQAGEARDKLIVQVLRDASNLELPNLPVDDKPVTTSFDAQHLEKIRDCATSTFNLVNEHKMLQSLVFDMMQTREATISRAYTGTFDWLLRSCGHDFGTADHTRELFAQWLQNSDDIYWIGGKPGSGKSTLMKHIFHDPETRKFLRTWAGMQSLTIAGYFFWHRGNELQRSQQGLLQHLLYTILEATPGLANELCEARTTQPEKPWTLLELESVFRNLGHGSTVQHRFCFFIDGLDEYSGDHFELVECLQVLPQSPRIKLCLASRPWPCFEDAFGQTASRRLYLQDLTKPDIRRYARDKLDNAKMQSLSKDEIQEFDEVIDEVVEKSQGVFVWVTLVVRSLREGLSNGDSIATLQQRVRAFPADLEPFFESLIEAVESTYQQIMATTFLVALETTALPLVTYAFLEEGHYFALHLKHEEYTTDRTLTIQNKMRRRINGRYKGLLECWDTTQPFGDYRLAVEFLHRTVRDFLLTAPIQHMLQSYIEDNFDAHRRLCRIRLAQLKTMPTYERGSLGYVVVEILNLARLQQMQSGDCDYSVLDQLREVAIGRRDFRIDRDEEYIGILARTGLSTYLQEYLKRHPKCLAEEHSIPTILYLLERPNTAKGIHGADQYDLYVTEEVLFIARMLLKAGSNPCAPFSGKSAWTFLVNIVCYPSLQCPPYLLGIIEPLLQEFVSYGASFSDLVPSSNDQASLALPFIRTAISHAPSLKLLQSLLEHGCDPMQTYAAADNGSLWSLVLDHVRYLFINGDKATYAAEAIVLCLRHGADQKSPVLRWILKGPHLNADGKTKIRAFLKRTPKLKNEQIPKLENEQTAKLKNEKTETRGWLSYFRK
ncbi:hypothetical protein BDV96DRAFT_193503 [Lophiotrema nucula]|uniref:Uncharacterized protein n=1 Tax=Lophiotrema nucula TaxID=690887 RepID=A0A6A5YWM4_9PLEO|nr:hypothetical protein BDV96DRAFT_193503 [Lophiotrema nucula]